MGNSLIGVYDRQFSKNSVLEWQRVDKNQDDQDENDDTVAKPLKAPYAPSDVKIRNPLYVEDVFPPRNGSYISMRTYSLPTPNINQNNRYFQTHSLYHTIDKVDDPMCPVAISSRTLEPVRVGTGVVLTKVVQVLQDYPLTNGNNSSPTSPNFRSKNKVQVPRAPVSSPDLFLKNFGHGLNVVQNMNESFDDEDDAIPVKIHLTNFDVSMTDSHDITKHYGNENELKVKSNG
ncbi:UNVERIFIED_CONTAM: hypothetical protein RMT77_010474 [Armadillidium vulgare]